MLKKICFPLALCVSTFSSAQLVSLNQDELLNTVGQGGADLSWTLSLNHKYANDMSLKNISELSNGEVTTVNYQYACSNDVLCRFAFSPNNHRDENGQKWLVFKQIQGTIQIDRFSLEGTTIINKDKNPQTAMLLKFYDEHPLKIRNLGFASLAVESGDEGYLNNTLYTTYNNGSQVPSFDQGQEQGFMGLNVHGNLHLSGDIKIFSYNCSGAATSRC